MCKKKVKNTKWVLKNEEQHKFYANFGLEEKNSKERNREN